MEIAICSSCKTVADVTAPDDCPRCGRATTTVEGLCNRLANTEAELKRTAQDLRRIRGTKFPG